MSDLNNRPEQIGGGGDASSPGTQAVKVRSKPSSRDAGEDAALAGNEDVSRKVERNQGDPADAQGLGAADKGRQRKKNDGAFTQGAIAQGLLPVGGGRILRQPEPAEEAKTKERGAAGGNDGYALEDEANEPANGYSKRDQDGAGA